MSGNPDTGIAGVVLAGGQSRRFDGQTKSLLTLAGIPLIDIVVSRLAPQVDQVFFSVESHCSALEGRGLHQVFDPSPGHQGPLGGLYASMRYLVDRGPEEWLLLVPCDAPFLPADLAERLLHAAQSERRPGAIACYQDEYQPTFSLWNKGLLRELQEAIEVEKLRGFKQFLKNVELAIVDWPRDEVGEPFFNVNSRGDLAMAEKMVAAAA